MAVDMYNCYYKFREWQEVHRRNGFHVERLSGGQTRRYGPTEESYIVIYLNPYDWTNPEEKIREYCTTKIHRADDPPKHTLREHLIEFKKIGPRTYLYKCGHDWTG